MSETPRKMTPRVFPDDELLDKIDTLTRERDAAVFAMKMATEERDAAKYGLDRLGAELESTDAEHEHSVRALADTYQALERVTRERDEARERRDWWRRNCAAASEIETDLVAQRDALRAEVERLRGALQGLDAAYCRAGDALTKAERHEDRLRLIAARAALTPAEVTK